MSRHCLLLLGGLVLTLSAGGCRRGNDAPPENGDGQAPAPLSGTAAPETGYVTVDVELSSGDQVGITVANGTTGSVDLRGRIRVEQEDGDEWRQLEAVGDIWLRDSCSAVASDIEAEGAREPCQQLPALTRVEVPPWLGTFGDAQCACERCARVPAGRYRIVVFGCDGERFQSMPVSIRLREDEE